MRDSDSTPACCRAESASPAPRPCTRSSSSVPYAMTCPRPPCDRAGRPGSTTLPAAHSVLWTCLTRAVAAIGSYRPDNRLLWLSSAIRGKDTEAQGPVATSMRTSAVSRARRGGPAVVPGRTGPATTALASRRAGLRPAGGPWSLADIVTPWRAAKASDETQAGQADVMGELNAALSGLSFDDLEGVLQHVLTAGSDVGPFEQPPPPSRRHPGRPVVVTYRVRVDLRGPSRRSGAGLNSLPTFISTRSTTSSRPRSAGPTATCTGSAPARTITATTPDRKSV